MGRPYSTIFSAIGTALFSVVVLIALGPANPTDVARALLIGLFIGTASDLILYRNR